MFDTTIWIVIILLAVSSIFSRVAPLFSFAIWIGVGLWVSIALNGLWLGLAWAVLILVLLWVASIIWVYIRDIIADWLY